MRGIFAVRRMLRNGVYCGSLYSSVGEIASASSSNPATIPCSYSLSFSSVTKPSSSLPISKFQSGQHPFNRNHSSSSSSASTITPNFGIEVLTGANFVSWRDSVKLTLGMLDLDYALRHDAPTALTAESTADQKQEYEKWERSNRMSLMVIKNSISVTIRGAIPDSDNAKIYLKSVEEQFKGSSKAHASTLILKMLTTKYDGFNNVREHIMMMNDMAHKLKSLDMEISDGFLVHFIMTSLPSRFDAFKINYNTQKEKWSMGELIAMCVQEEERLKLEKPDVVHVTTIKALKRKGNFKGESSKVHKAGTSAASSSNVSFGQSRCKFCHNKGHTQRDCPKFKEWLAKKGIPYNPEAGKKPKDN